MRSLRNLILFSFFVSCFAQAVNIIWVEYDADEQKLKGQLEYFGAEDQAFKLEFDEDAGALVGRVVEVEQDDSDEEEMTAHSAQRGKHHLKKWERRKMKKEAEIEKRAAARAARAEEQEVAAHRNQEQEFEFDFIDEGRPVYFVINNVRILVIGTADEDDAEEAPAPAARANLTHTPAAAAAAPLPFTFFAAPMPFNGGSQ